jgi:hypothetical protein
MAQPTSREDFSEWCLRKLGHPVISINVTEDQINDRIDEALEFWRDYFYDGSELVYIKHELTAEDVEQGFVYVPERLLGVVRIFDFGGSTSGGMFNAQYQFALNNVADVAGYNTQHYYMTMQHMELIREVMVGRPMVRYNRHSNKLFLDMSKSKLIPGMFILIEAYDIIDEEEYADVWRDRWLQNYATVLIKEQWGNNLTKFVNAQLVGGIQFNGEQILSTAVDERRRIEEDAIKNLQPLVYNFSG